ncbi:MAG: PEGA domain-containing protein [Sandaracinus sp.]
MRRVTLVSLAWIVVGWLAPMALCATACAQDAVRARFFDDAARAAYGRGDYESALADFFEVARVAPTQGTLYNIAICADLTHRDALAYESLERYLAGPAEDEARSAEARTRLAAIAARVARVEVTSQPTGATIWVDRRELGAYGVTPRTLVLSPGRHVVTLTHPRAGDASVEVEAALGAPGAVSLRLEPRVGRLRIRVEDGIAAASVELRAEGEATEPTGTPLVVEAGRETTLPIGRYRGAVRAEGYADAELIVTVREASVEERTVTLVPRPRPTGTLAVRTDVDAIVRIDGVERARTPARIPRLEVGTHRVEVRSPGHLPWTADVAITEDRVRYLTVTLVSQRAP